MLKREFDEFDRQAENEHKALRRAKDFNPKSKSFGFVKSKHASDYNKAQFDKLFSK